MEQAAEKHKECYARPSLLLVPTDIMLKAFYPLASVIPKPLAYQFLDEYEQELQEEHDSQLRALNKMQLKAPDVRKTICNMRDEGYETVTQNPDVKKAIEENYQSTLSSDSDSDDEKIKEYFANAVRLGAKLMLRLSKIF